MKALTYYIGAALAAGALMTGCSSDELIAQGEGRVMITATVNSDVRVVSRAATEQELADECTIWISSEKGLVRKFEGMSSLPAEGIWLTAGSYVAEAWTGDSVSADFEKRYFKGYERFEIKPSTTTPVELTCKIANVVASVSYGDEVDEVLTDYTMTVGHSRGSLDFEGRDERKGYFMMPSTDTDLIWTLTGTTNEGKEFSRTGTIANARPATEYHLNVRYTGETTEVGGAYFTIEIDATEVVVEDEILISLAPEIAGIGYEIANPVYAEAREVGRKSVYITAASALTSVVVENNSFGRLLGISGDDFDLLKMSDNVKATLEAKGINFKYVYDDEADISNLRLNFEEEFTSLLTLGEYPITITATDALGKTTSATLNIFISDLPVNIEDVDPADVWAHTARLTAAVTKTDAEPGFVYRKAGSQEWIAAPTTLARSTMSAELTGLEAGTTYEYAAVAGDFTSAVKRFTTEAEAQIPNGGFEVWNTSSTPYLIGDRSFWDSGNHGSATLNINVTVPDNSIKHSGNYSIKMTSDFPSMFGIGKFAAGNVFTGRYLDTNGTDGELGWGRKFTSRPRALRGYVKYVSTEVNCNGGTQNKPQGYQDQGIVYIAVLDATTKDFTTSKSKDHYTEFPVIIQTKEQNLFDKTAPNVLAYGEKIFDTTSGEGMIEFEIPLEYTNTGVKAGHIMIVASSSRQGDYFIGGKGSTMWLDDLELVY